VIALSDQESSWIGDLASRLRLVQADTATSLPEKRREFLSEEIARGLRDVPPANRKRFIEALLARFPVAGQNLKVAAPPPVSMPLTPAEPPPETFEQLLNRFIKAADELPAAERERAARTLTEAGLAWVGRDSLAVELSEELQRTMGLPAGQEPRLGNVVKLCGLLHEMIQKMNTLLLETVRDLNAKSPILKRPADLRGAAAQFLLGEEGALKPQMALVLSIQSALSKAISDGGRDFGREHLGRFSPSAIEDVVMGEGGVGIFGNKKEKCWEKYVKLAENLTSDVVNRQIRDSMAAIIERKMSDRR
jgi:hypothetical protein